MVFNAFVAYIQLLMGICSRKHCVGVKNSEKTPKPNGKPLNANTD